MSNYCAKGKELLLDLKRSDWLPQYDEEAMRSIAQEICDLWQKMDTLTQSYQQLGDLPEAKKVTLKYFGECINRDITYTNAFLNHRLQRIRELRWESGPVLDEAISRDVLSQKEREYFTKYNDIVAEYIEELGVDITADLEPPKELHIEIRVLEDCGEIMTENGPMRLSKNSILFVRRTAVESFIKEGKVQHIATHGEC